MSLALDMDAIRNRFMDEWDERSVATFYANGDIPDPQETNPYVRFTINPGARSLIGGGRLYRQLGRVTLQVFIPTGIGQITAYEYADQFNAIFRNWKSEDEAVRTYGEGDTVSYADGENGMYQLNVSIRFESTRVL